MDKKDDATTIIMEKIEAMPKEMQRVIFHFLKNIAIIDQLVENEIMGEANIKKYTQIALEKKDCFMLLLITYKQLKDKSKLDF